ncbi:MAG: hypothetical protein ACPIOQ_23585, partial [Promethearchaeia archaeon]
METATGCELGTGNESEKSHAGRENLQRRDCCHESCGDASGKLTTRGGEDRRITPQGIDPRG